MPADWMGMQPDDAIQRHAMRGQAKLSTNELKSQVGAGFIAVHDNIAHRPDCEYVGRSDELAPGMDGGDIPDIASGLADQRAGLWRQP